MLLLATVLYSAQFVGLLGGMGLVTRRRRTFHNPYLWEALITIGLFLVLTRIDQVGNLYGFDPISPEMTLLTSTGMVIAFLIAIALAYRTAQQTEREHREAVKIKSDLTAQLAAAQADFEARLKVIEAEAEQLRLSRQMKVDKLEALRRKGTAGEWVFQDESIDPTRHLNTVSQNSEA